MDESVRAPLRQLFPRLLVMALLVWLAGCAQQSDSAPSDPLSMYSTDVKAWNPADGLYWKSEDGFNPWSVLMNAALVCAVDTPHLAKEIHEQVLGNIENGYIVHSTPYVFEDIEIAAPWISGFSNGVTLTAMSALYECYGDDRYLQTAHELFKGYLDGGFTTELAPGQVWFQEYPIPDSRVLNGHIYALLGLYYYHLVSDNAEALKLLNSGATAVAIHGWEYRRPGQVNLYDLYGEATDDYGPARTIFQQDALCAITGDARFRELRDAFAADMPEQAETVNFLCTADP